MTTAQKIIKYIANAFAIVLIVTIISTILNIGYEILTGVGVINFKENKILADLITISDNIEEISTLKLDIKGSDVQIKTGEKFEVKTNNPNINYVNENGKVTIKEEKISKWNIGKDDGSLLIIYLPEDIKQMDKVKMDIGAGTIDIGKINTKSLYLDLGAGNVTIDDLNVSEETKINGGAGNININSGKIANINFDLGIGDTTINADITGNSKIDTGIGKLNVYLTLAKEEYKIDIEKGVGEIRFNDTIVSNDTSIGDGNNHLKINGGVGEINIKTEI